MQEVKEAMEIVDAMGTEVYYDFNLRIVMAEATDAEREVVKDVLARARAERERIAATRKDAR